MNLSFRTKLALFLFLVPRVALAHEFWIEARGYQVPEGEKIEAGLFNGQDFAGVEMAWFEGRTAFAGWMLGPHGGGFDSRAGDRPALSLARADAGLLQLVYQSTGRDLTYTDWAKFESFARSKGHDWAVARHAERGLEPTGFTENYTRFAKALIAVGPGHGADRAIGLEAELVAHSNPYVLPPQTGFVVEMRYQGRPLSGARIDVFEKNGHDPNAEVTRFHVTTDLGGIATVPLRPGYRYLLDSVVLREPQPGADHAWESLWASLTFEVPR